MLFFAYKKKILIFATDFAGVAQLVEHDLAKVGVAGSSPVSRSNKKGCASSLFFQSLPGVRCTAGATILLFCDRPPVGKYIILNIEPGVSVDPLFLDSVTIDDPVYLQRFTPAVPDHL
jgi:hypothetical protein